MTNSASVSAVSSVSEVSFEVSEFEFDFEAHVAAIDAVCVPTAAQVFHVTFFVALPVVDRAEINPLFLETIVIEKTFAGSIATIFDSSYNLARYPFIVEAQLPSRYNFALKAGERMPPALVEDRKIQKVFMSHGFYKWNSEDQAPLREWWNARKIARIVSRDGDGHEPSELELHESHNDYLHSRDYPAEDDDVTFLF